MLISVLPAVVQSLLSPYIVWREGRTVKKTPNPGAMRPEYRDASAEVTMLIDAVPPTPETMLFQGLK
jgi:hypothetical protein